MNKTFEVRTEQIGQSALLQYKTWLLEHYAVRSANSMLVALNVFMTFAQWDCEKLKLMRTQSFGCDDQRYEMSVHDYHCLAAAARKAKNPQLELILETLVCTGIRVSELICFTVESIKKGSVSIRNKGKYRRIPLPGCLRGGSGKGWIFVCFSEKWRPMGYFFLPQQPSRGSGFWPP